MKKLLSFLAVLLLLPTVVFAKSIDLKEFNYTDGGYEGFMSVSETLDGGYVAVGENSDYHIIVKYDKNDKIEWRKFLDFSGQIVDVDIDELGNIYVVGYINTNETIDYNHNHGYVAKLDSTGKVLWETHVGDDAVDRIELLDLEVANGKIVAVGINCYGADNSAEPDEYPGEESCYDSYYVTLDTDGKTLTYGNFGGRGFEYFYGVTLTKDGGFVAVGGTDSLDIEEFDVDLLQTPMIVKFDKDSKIVWKKNLPTDSRLNEENTCSYGAMDGFYMDVIENCDGGYTVVGAVPYLTQMKNTPELSASWNNVKENLGTVGPTEIEEVDTTMNYQSAAAIIATYDKDGNKKDEYIYNGLYNDAYSDILEVGQCNYLVTGIDGHEAAARPMSLRSSEEILGWNSNTCIYSDSDASITYFTNGLKPEWNKTYEGTEQDVLYNISPAATNEFVAVGIFESEDIEEFELSEYYDGMVVRLKINYEITKNPTENGSFDASNEHGKADIVSHGDTATVTTVPEEGYKVNSVKVVDSKGEEVPVTKIENGKYTYPIYDDTWVTVTFAKEEVAENPKTGVQDLLLIGMVVLALGGAGYYTLSKKQLFRKI